MTSLLARFVQPLVRRRMKGRGDDEATMRRELTVERARDATPAKLVKQGLARCADRHGMQVWEVGRADAPRTVLYLHGGAYVARIQPTHWSFIAAMAKRLDAPFVVPFYALAPEHDLAGALPPLVGLYRELRADGSSARLVVMGDSAGGGLALSLLNDAADRPAALVLIAPWLDLTVSDPSQPGIEPRDAMLSIERLRIAGRWWQGGMADDDARIAVADRADSTLPPTLLLCGGDDLLVADARRFVRANSSVRYVEEPGLCHVYPLLFFAESRRARRQIVDFVEQQFG